MQVALVDDLDVGRFEGLAKPRFDSIPHPG
jgi:hypothetical protein